MARSSVHGVAKNPKPGRSLTSERMPFLYRHVPRSPFITQLLSAAAFALPAVAVAIMLRRHYRHCSVDNVPVRTHGYAIGREDLQPGDILLYRAKKTSMISAAIRLVTRSPYSHAALYLRFPARRMWPISPPRIRRRSAHQWWSPRRSEPHGMFVPTSAIAANSSSPIRVHVQEVAPHLEPLGLAARGQEGGREFIRYRYKRLGLHQDRAGLGRSAA